MPIEIQEFEILPDTQSHSAQAQQSPPPAEHVADSFARWHRERAIRRERMRAD